MSKSCFNTRFTHGSFKRFIYTAPRCIHHIGFMGSNRLKSKRRRPKTHRRRPKTHGVPQGTTGTALESWLAGCCKKSRSERLSVEIQNYGGKRCCFELFESPSESALRGTPRAEEDKPPKYRPPYHRHGSRCQRCSQVVTQNEESEPILTHLGVSNGADPVGADEVRARVHVEDAGV